MKTVTDGPELWAVLEKLGEAEVANRLADDINLGRGGKAHWPVIVQGEEIHIIATSEAVRGWLRKKKRASDRRAAALEAATYLAAIAGIVAAVASLVQLFV